MKICLAICKKQKVLTETKTSPKVPVRGISLKYLSKGISCSAKYILQQTALLIFRSCQHYTRRCSVVIFAYLVELCNSFRR